MRLRFAIPVVVLAFLSGATAQAQRSIDEAIRVVESFRGDTKNQQAAAPVSFVAPPRTIADITAILDRQKPDAAKRAANLAAADRDAPSGGTPAELADFYLARGNAAGEVGRAQQRLDDLKRGVDLAKEAKVPIPRLVGLLQSLAEAYRFVGDLKTSLDIQEERLQLMGRNPGGQGIYFSIYQYQANVAARTGRLDLARDAVAKGERLLNEAVGWRGVLQPQRDLWRAFMVRSRGAIAAETGQLAIAESGVRESLDLITNKVIPYATTIGAPADGYDDLRNIVIAQLARILSRQGRLVEAEAEMRRSLLSRLERRGRYSSEVAADLVDLAAVIYAQGRYGEAEKLADAARDIYENLGHGAGSDYLLASRAEIARAQAAQGRFDVARATYAALEQDVGSNSSARRRFLDNNINYATVLLRAGDAAQAAGVAERALSARVQNLGERHYDVAQARGWLGVALARGGQNDRARQEFETAMPILLASSRQVDDGDDDGSAVAERDSQLQQVIEAYLGLLADSSGPAAAVEAFRLADAIRGRSVQRALAASSARAAAANPALANLVRNEQDAQKQAAALQGLLTNMLTRPTSEQDPRSMQKLREDIDKLRTARARLREEIERAFPEYVNLIDPRPATIEQAQKSLKPGEALIATYVGEERLFVWAVPHQGPVSYASTKVTDTAIATLVADLRKALDPNADTLDAVPAFDVAAAYKLYEMLLKPIEAGWNSAQSLMIVPHKALGQLPMSLLVTAATPQPAKSGVFFAEYKNVPFLARKVAVTQLPSVASLGTLRNLPAAPANRETFVAFGDPWFSPEQATEAKNQQVAALQTRGKLVRRNVPKTEGVDSAELALLPRLPDTAEEVRSIALALKADLTKDVFIGAAANENAVRTMDLSKRKIVMFATHGLVPGDLNGLTQPALALSAPKVANVDGDGLLTMEEVLALKLNADWVVLSACNTATGSGAGAEAVSGLGRAFFYAGTRALLVSNWPVETVSARILTTDLFRRQAENAALARGEAMRQAMIALIDSPGAVDPDSKQAAFSYAHPIFWAPFSVVGDGG